MGPTQGSALLIPAPACWICRDPPCVLQVLVPEMAAWRQRIQLLHCPLPAWSPLCLHGLAGPGPRCRVSGGSRGGWPTGWGEKKEALALGGRSLRNGLWPPEVGGAWGVEYQHPRPSLVWLICCSVVNAAPVKGFIFTACFLGQSLEPASASHLLLPCFQQTVCGGCDFALLKSLILPVLLAEGS